jgi:hypothetical protein
MPFRQPWLPDYFEETGPMRAIVALVFGGWFRNVLAWGVDGARHDRVQVEKQAVTDDETGEPMWVLRW